MLTIVTLWHEFCVSEVESIKTELIKQQNIQQEQRLTLATKNQARTRKYILEMSNEAVLHLLTDEVTAEYASINAKYCYHLA